MYNGQIRVSILPVGKDGAFSGCGHFRENALGAQYVGLIYRIWQNWKNRNRLRTCGQKVPALSPTVKTHQERFVTVRATSAPSASGKRNGIRSNPNALFPVSGAVIIFTRLSARCLKVRARRCSFGSLRSSSSPRPATASLRKSYKESLA